MQGMRRACMFMRTCVHAFTSWLYGFLRLSTQTRPDYCRTHPLQEVSSVSEPDETLCRVETADTDSVFGNQIKVILKRFF